jgi:hypothetical protein
MDFFKRGNFIFNSSLIFMIYFAFFKRFSNWFESASTDRYSYMPLGISYVVVKEAKTRV